MSVVISTRLRPGYTRPSEPAAASSTPTSYSQPTSKGLQSVPGRVMSGIQFFEARIGDQLLPVADYLDLLNRHGFREVDYFDITPVLAVTHGRR